jgi:ABC-type phosphate transport system auxiliary subunit
MSAQPSIDTTAMNLEHADLERRERQVSALRRKLHNRLDSFPNEVTAAHERQLSAERRELHRRIDALRGELRLIRD